MKFELKVGRITFAGGDIVKLTGSVIGAGILAGPVGVASMTGFHLGSLVGSVIGVDAGMEAIMDVLTKEEQDEVRERLHERRDAVGKKIVMKPKEQAA